MAKRYLNDLLIVIPTYNEAGNIKLLIERIQKLNIPADILIIDDNSSDGTGKIAEDLAKAFSNLSVKHRPQKLGIGSAHHEGITYAYEKRYKLLLTMDADFSHTPEDIPRFLEEIKRANIVVGTRFQRAESLKEWNFYRKSLTYLGYFLTRNFLGIPYDASGALRLYRLDRINPKVFSLVRARDYAFFFESLTILSVNKIPISQIPIDLPSRVYGSSKMEARQIARSVINLIKLSMRIRLKRKSLCLEASAPVDYPDSKRIKEEWDIYWLKDKNQTEKVFYDKVASFYRNYIIKPNFILHIRRNLAPGSLLLHAGCGGGEVEGDVINYGRVLALDISMQALGRHRSLHNGKCRYISGDILHIPFSDCSVDGVYNLGVMEHFENDAVIKIFRELCRVLKPGGKVILFWPSIFTPSVFVLHIVHFFFNKILRKNIRFHPLEPTKIRSRLHARNLLEQGGLKEEYYSFGIRDFFTYAVIIGVRPDNKVNSGLK